MDLFDIAIARKLSGGGGGGGGSYKTAKVTVNSSEGFYTCSYYDEQAGTDYVVGLMIKDGKYIKEYGIYEPIEFDVLLLEDPSPCLYVYSTPTITGDATASQPYGSDWLISISGDCTITT